MRAVWKQRLDEPNKVYELPGCELILCVKVQSGKPTIWFIHSPRMAEKKQHGGAVAAFTGSQLDPNAGDTTYMETFEDERGLVRHVFAWRAF